MPRHVAIGIVILTIALFVTRSAAEAEDTALRVDTKGVTTSIKYEAYVAGPLDEINGRYKLRVTEITIAPGGYVRDHNHLGPGIRQVISGHMHYLLPKETVVYGPGDFFFETGDVNHRVENREDAPTTHLLFEILPIDVTGASLISPRDHPSK